MALPTLINCRVFNDVDRNARLHAGGSNDDELVRKWRLALWPTLMLRLGVCLEGMGETANVGAVSAPAEIQT